MIGGFILLCLFAFGSTVFKQTLKLNQIPVIDKEEILAHNSADRTYKLKQNEFFNNWMLSDAKYILNNHLTFKSALHRCPAGEDSKIIPEKYNFREKFVSCAHPIYN